MWIIFKCQLTFQVDFGQLKTVTGVATQGHYRDNKWVTSYQVSYQYGSSPWQYYNLRTDVGPRKVRSWLEGVVPVTKPSQSTHPSVNIYTCALADAGTLGVIGNVLPHKSNSRGLSSSQEEMVHSSWQLTFFSAHLALLCVNLLSIIISIFSYMVATS